MKSDPIFLCRYFIVADRMKHHFTEIPPESTVKKDELTAHDVNVDIYMTLWYATLYVVIDAWQRMGMKRKRLDALLADENYTALLKGFRDDTFHYQPHDLRRRAVLFLKNRKAAKWIRDVHTEFHKYFRKEAAWYIRLAGKPYKPAVKSVSRRGKKPE
jgi:hypothetical protein